MVGYWTAARYSDAELGFCNPDDCGLVCFAADPVRAPACAYMRQSAGGHGDRVSGWPGVARSADPVRIVLWRGRDFSSVAVRPCGRESLHRPPRWRDCCLAGPAHL